MGGKVIVHDKDGVRWQGEPINVTFGRSEARAKISGFFSTLQAASFMVAEDRKSLDFYYTGSTEHLMGYKISDDEIAKYKPVFGDIDVQINKSQKDLLESLLVPGAVYGKYMVRGTTGHGQEISAVITDVNSDFPIQVDFQLVPEAGNVGWMFLHSAHWGDIQHKISGAFHKILLNAIGLDEWKFSITHGLRRRDGKEPLGYIDQLDISIRLFDGMFYQQTGSFIGLCALIRDHFDAKKQQAIYTKFKKSVAERYAPEDYITALQFLKNTINRWDPQKVLVLADE